MMYVQCIFTVRGTQSKAECKKELSHKVMRLGDIDLNLFLKRHIRVFRWISISFRTSISLQKDNKIDLR